MTLETLSIGGRSIATYLVFIYVLVFSSKLFSVQSRQQGSELKKNLLRIVLGSIGLLFLYATFGYFMTSRNENLVGYYDFYLGLQQHAWLSTWFTGLFGNIDSVMSFGYGITYFTSSIPGYTMLMEHKEITDEYWLGVQSFDVVAKIARILTGENYAIFAKDDIAAVIVSEGLYATNPWATFIRDVLMDFGYLGGLIFAGVCGWVCMRIFILTSGSTNYFNVCISLLILLSCFVMALRGPFNLTVISNSLFLLLTMYVFRKIFSKKRVP